MSSNFTVNRLCEQCGNVFVAKTTVTRFCSKLCNKRNGKQRSRNTKMAAMDKVVKKVLESKSEEDNEQEFLSVKEAAKLLNTSDKMVYRLINIGKIHAVNLSERKTTVRRSDIDRIFELPTVVKLSEVKPPKVSMCYHMAEAMQIFNISESALFHLIKRHRLFKFQQGRYTYVAKSDLNKIFNTETI
jgi:excisionase family DNA binding protein